ncbi:GPI mannosyltransferase 2 [Anoplophora glabripennis]|uniref:GPI mannosyltransferase 2 n=1 Tax=Anoplophora glabripennis TaxID=217634 RepID=UPI00087443E7|nr:GPI mannosyltransferase 2 [Anoplophora glabripennis]
MERTLTKFAVYTRICVIILQYFSNILIPDHVADAFVYPQASNISYNVIDSVVRHTLRGFVRWDAQYFMHIATYGYTFENTLAFFPLYPLLSRLCALVVCSVFPWMSLDSVLLLVFIGLNIILFVLSAKALFKLTTIFSNKTVAYKSTLLFCINPASIFFSAPYSECLFYYLTLQTVLNSIVLYKTYSKVKFKVDYRHILYILPIGLSAVVRSNGILNIGFLVYAYICICIKHWPRNNFIRRIIFITKAMFIISLLTIICLLPYSVYQVYCYYMFCRNFDIELPSNIVVSARRNDYVLPGQFSKYNQSWCYDRIPHAYSYVQNHYWKVGFLKYYELKQLPNFLLAAPVLIILIKMSCQHIIHNASKNVIHIFSFDKLFNKKKEVDIKCNPILNVFVIHMMFLLLFCISFVHIQVSTRMLCSASPLFYWYCASFFKDTTLGSFSDAFSRKISLGEYIIIVYFLSYFFVGTVMFCNFLPWT